MATTTGEKDARRRRLKERGTDRLALITGRIQTLPSPSPTTEIHHSHTASCPPLIPDDFEQSSLVSPSETRDFHPPLPKHNSTTEPRGVDDSKGTFTRSKTDVYRASASEPDDKIHPINSPSILSPAPEQRLQHPTSHKIFTTNQIIYAIAVSESTRIYFSLLTAILVVLSYIRFPIVSSLFVFSKPVYLVLLTNITIVLARILLDKRGGVYRDEREVGSDGGSDASSDLAGQVGMALESGFLMQNIMGAIFMDTSIYAVVVISGISLAQTLGW